MDDHYYSLFRHQPTNNDALTARAGAAAAANLNWASAAATDQFAASVNTLHHHNPLAAAAATGIHHPHDAAATTLDDYGVSVAAGETAGFAGLGGAGTAAATAAARSTITNPALLRRQRRRQQQKPATSKPSSSQILYHAIRPDGVLLQEPVIFFGLQDFQQYASYMQQQQSFKFGAFRTTTTSAQLVYRVFDSLADAFAYVQGHTEGDDVELPRTTTATKKSAAAYPETEDDADDEQEEPQASDQSDHEQGADTDYWETDEEGSPSKRKSKGKKTSRRSGDNTTATPNATDETTTRTRPKRWLMAWEAKYALLREYKTEFGDCHVPTNKKHPMIQNQYRPLAKWVAKQRTALNYFDKDPAKYPLKIMTMEQRQRLLDLGFVQNFNELKRTNKELSPPQRMAFQRKFNILFEKKMEDLKAFKVQHGHLNVPKTNASLYNWLKRIYGLYKKLEAEKNLKKDNNNNDKSGSGTAPDADKTNNDAATPAPPAKPKGKHNRDPKTSNGPACLQLEHLVALTSIGWSFKGAWAAQVDAYAKNIRERAAEYVEFVQTHKRLPHYSAVDAEERRLGKAAQRWKRTRKQVEAGEEPPSGMQTLTEDVIADLDAVGFKWEIRDLPAKRPRGEDGAATDVEDVVSPRPYKKRQKRKSATPDPKMKRVSWETKYELLKKYRQKHGHVDPPTNHRKLGAFVKEQRRQYKLLKDGWQKSSMTLDKYKLLSEIGFRFQTKKGPGRPSLTSRGGGGGHQSSGYDTTSSEEEEEEEEAQLQEQEEKAKEEQAAGKNEMVETEAEDNAGNEGKADKPSKTSGLVVEEPPVKDMSDAAPEKNLDGDEDDDIPAPADQPVADATTDVEKDGDETDGARMMI